MTELLYEVSGGVARLTLNRPQLHNAFDDAMIGALDETLTRVREDPAVRVVVLRPAVDTNPHSQRQRLLLQDLD